MKNSTEYEKIQEIIETSGGERRVFLTDDHEYLTVSVEKGNYTEVYKYSEDSQLFKRIKIFTYPEPVEYISISPSKNLLAISTTDKTEIYKGL